MRCVVLRGAGDHFSAGDDLQSAHRGRRRRLGGDDRGLPAAHAGGAGRPGAGDRRGRRRLRGRRARVRGELRPAPVHRPRAADHARGRDRPGGEQRRHAAAARGARRDRRRASCCWAARSATPAWAREHGFATELVAPRRARRAHRALGGVFSRNSRAAVAATKAMLNERFGALLGEAMDRETHHCVRLFDEPDARAALRELRRAPLLVRTAAWIEVAPSGADTPIALCPPGPGVSAGGKDTGISLGSEDVDVYSRPTAGARRRRRRRGQPLRRDPAAVLVPRPRGQLADGGPGRPLNGFAP